MPKSKSRAAVIDGVSTRAAESRLQAVGPDWSALVPAPARDPDRLSADRDKNSGALRTASHNLLYWKMLRDLSGLASCARLRSRGESSKATPPGSTASHSGPTVAVSPRVRLTPRSECGTSRRAARPASSGAIMPPSQVSNSTARVSGFAPRAMAWPKSGTPHSRPTRGP